MAGWKPEFEGTGPIARTILGEPVVFYRRTNGELVALHDRCAHRWAPLSFGRVEGDNLRCMYHGVVYGPDGNCVSVPGQQHIGPALCVTQYPTVEKYQLVWIWMGDPAQADIDLIPDLRALDQDSRRLYCGSLEYDANYALINDNLLDLSHIAFLHEASVGRPVTPARPVAPAREKADKPYVVGGAEAYAIERGVRVQAWVTGAHARTAIMSRTAPDGDVWSWTNFMIPGLLISSVKMYAEGTAEACRGAAPDDSQTVLYDFLSIQGVTPVAERKTKYFYSMTIRASDVDKAEADGIWATINMAFGEDVRMIEAVQKTIINHPGHRMGGIAADRGLVLFRNMMKKLIVEETSRHAE